MTAEVDYEQKALLYAEKYGIIEYNVNGNIMEYYEIIGGYASDSIYDVKYNLDTMKEDRVQVQ